MVEIGDYIRTKNGYIGKLLKFAKDKDFFANIESDFILGGMPIKKKDILKYSKNLIDLIQEGDYVNGMIVDKDIRGLLCSDKDGYFHYIDDIQIKTIVTKELFESVKYKVEDK